MSTSKTKTVTIDATGPIEVTAFGSQFPHAGHRVWRQDTNDYVSPGEHVTLEITYNEPVAESKAKAA